MTSAGSVQEVDRATSCGFRRVVVGIDGSRESYEAARQALRLADDDASADLVTAYAPFVPLMGLTGAVAPTYLDEERLRAAAEETVDHALAVVDGRAHGYARPGVPWDALIDAGGRPAELSPQTLARLDEVLPSTWSRGNPVDIIGDAPASRFASRLPLKGS